MRVDSTVLGHKAGIIFGYSDSREVFLGNFFFSCLVSFFSRLFNFFPEYNC
jgi:hypothetical protein